VPNNGLMASLPRPLIALLVGTVAAFVLWTVALKHSGAAGSANSPSPAVAQSAIAKAHQAAALSDKASAADGAPVSSGSAPAKQATKPATNPAAQPAVHAASHPSAAAKPADAAKALKTLDTLKISNKAPAKSQAPVSEKAVLAAISAHKVVALLFFNPAGADDTAVQHELATVSTGGGKVAKFAVPLSQLTHFGALTTRVPVDATPTLILINPQGAASSLVGFADKLEITQRISDALSGK
jgi:hypothetical protein